MPSRFRRTRKFVDLGFERFGKLYTDSKAWRRGAFRQPGVSEACAAGRRESSYPPPIDWNAKRARARAPPGRKSDGHLYSNTQNLYPRGAHPSLGDADGRSILKGPPPAEAHRGLR